MTDKSKTKKQLLTELEALRCQITKMEEGTRELVLAHNLYRQLLENPLVGIWQADHEGRFTFINKRVAEATGYTPEEAIGMSLLEPMAPESRPWLEERMQARMAGRIPPEILEVEVVHKDESRFTALVTPAGIYDEQGNFAGFIGTMIDVTDRKRAQEALQDAHDHLEQRVAERTADLEAANERLQKEIAERRQTEKALRQSEEKYRTLFETMAQGVVYQDAAGHVTSANPSAERILGFMQGQMLGVTPMDPRWTMVHEDGSPLSGQTLPSMVALRTGKEIRDFVIGVLNQRTDEYSWITVNAMPQFRSGEAAPYQVYTTFDDITERKQAEEQLRQYQRIVDASRDHMALLDRSYFYQSVNDAYLRSYGKERGDIVGHSVPELFGQEFFEKRQKAFIDKCLAGEVVKYQMWVDFPAEGRRYVDVALYPYLDEDRSISGYVVNARDRTEEKELETQLIQAQKMEAVGTLAGGVAHDFNNLLSPILGYVDLILMDLHPEDPRYDNLCEVQRAANRARDLTRQLLAFSRKQVFEMKTLDVGEVVSSFEKMLRRTIREDIDIKLNLEPSLGSVEGDVSQIEHILMNLAVNAQDAMPDGGTMTIETANVVVDEDFIKGHPGARPGPHVMFAVSDTGTGIEQKDLDHLFEPFFTTKEKGKGTGLGLATVYGIVKQHSGNIWASSEPGKATTFKILLPRVEDSEVTAPRTPERSDSSRGTETVVVVEDNETVRKLTADIVREYGYKVIEAASAQECLQVFEHIGPVHLLLTDVVMPDMNGRELWRQLSTIRPELKVLFMSGHADDLIAQHGVLEKGMNFISKPFSVEILARKVRDVIDS